MKKSRINREIDAKQVLLIDQEGESCGVVSIQRAMSQAQEAGLDLVEVSPGAQPPVCKILDYNRLRFDKKKDAKGKQKTRLMKEIKLRPVTDKNDVAIKVKKIIDFLDKGHKVKVTIFYRRRREAAFQDLSESILQQVTESIEEHGRIESEPKFEGRSTSMIIAPKKGVSQ